MVLLNAHPFTSLSIASVQQLVWITTRRNWLKSFLASICTYLVLLFDVCHWTKTLFLRKYYTMLKMSLHLNVYCNCYLFLPCTALQGLLPTWGLSELQLSGLHVCQSFSMRAACQERLPSGQDSSMSLSLSHGQWSQGISCSYEFHILLPML